MTLPFSAKTYAEHGIWIFCQDTSNKDRSLYSGLYVYLRFKKMQANFIAGEQKWRKIQYNMEFMNYFRPVARNYLGIFSPWRFFRSWHIDMRRNKYIYINTHDLEH
jgi:hypothetical protein